MSDPHDPDGLSEFGSESDDGKTTRPQTTPRSDEDWLAAFATEPRSVAAPRAQTAAFDDELNQFAPDQILTLLPIEADHSLDEFPEQESTQQAPAVVVRSQPWAGPWAAAVVAIVVSVLLGTRSLHPAWWNTGRFDTPQPAHYASAPDVEGGISVQTLRQFESVPVAIPRVAPPRSTASREIARVSPRVSRPLTVTAAPSIAPLASATNPREVIVPDVPAPRLRTDLTALTPANVPDPAVQEYAVRRALLSYEKAYENLDVAATAAVWPSVDRRALARAFDTLKSQGLDFKSCAITVMDGSATARCRGTLQVIRKVGNSMPVTAEQEWIFKMRRSGADWKIDDVAASRSSGLIVQPQRSHSQG